MHMRFNVDTLIFSKHHAKSLRGSSPGNCYKFCGDTFDGARNTHCSTAQESMRGKQPTSNSR